MSSDSPKVTVLMPVYNGERYLKEAVESILNQTFRDFEFIIIDGGSTDTSPAILTSYQQSDDRMHTYFQKNEGIVASLNMGCQPARGDYIARMDADDVSLPQRLARQVEYLDAHPDIGVLGTWVESIDESNNTIRDQRFPVTPSLVGWCLIFGNCLAHGSVMMRHSVIERVGFYRTDAVQAEDYDLWTRVSLVTQVANLPETLVRYRVWQASASVRHAQAVAEYADKVSHSMITRLLSSEVPLESVTNLRRVLNGVPLDNPRQIDQAATLVKLLHRAYSNANSLSRAETREIAHDAGMKLLTLAASTGKISPVKRFGMLAQALRLSPRILFSRRVIAKGVKISMRRG